MNRDCDQRLSPPTAPTGAPAALKPELTPPASHDSASWWVQNAVAERIWLCSLPLLVGLIGGLFALFSTQCAGLYGCSLFVLLPATMGWFSVMLPHPYKPISLAQAMFRSAFSMSSMAALFLLIGAEGALCMFMAAPVLFFFGLIGGFVAWHMRRPEGRQTYRRAANFIVLFAPCLFLGAEYIAQPESSIFRVTTAIEIDAPPETVWNHVVAFPELPPPDEWIFWAGVAYPQRARIVGQGVGAVRYCEFSTGPFAEPITVWDEPRKLAFDVTHNPPPMTEWSFFQEVHPPHLEGFLVSKAGQFELEELPGGRTRLVGTTWYQHGLWPEFYWRWWSDWMIHAIHRRVLEHIRTQAERSSGGR